MILIIKYSPVRSPHTGISFFKCITHILINYIFYPFCFKSFFLTETLSVEFNLAILEYKKRLLYIL